MRRVLSALAVPLLSVPLLATGSTASSSAAAPVHALGVCVKGKAWRVLEPANLSKSRFGKCATGEKRQVLLTEAGVQAAIAKAVAALEAREFGRRFAVTHADGSTEVCRRSGRLAGAPHWTCARPVPSPSASPSPSPSPTVVAPSPTFPPSPSATATPSPLS